MEKKENKNFWIDEYGAIRIGRVVILSTILLFLLITIICSFTTIKSGEVGLKTRFGKITNTSIKEGINFKIPYIERIVKVNIKVQKNEIEIESSTKDLQIINTDVAINYRVNPDEASNLYKQVGNEYETTILEPAIKESTKNAIAQYTAEEITIRRAEVSESCLENIQNKVSKYGIVIEDFNLTNFSFSEEYTKAIEEKQVAEQKVQTAKQELEKEKINSEKKIVAAEATKKENELLKSTINDDILLKQFIDKWDGKLPTTYAGKDIMSIFNLK